MSDEQYRLAVRAGDEGNGYDLAARLALRDGKTAELLDLLPRRLHQETRKIILQQHPELSYRAVEWSLPRAKRTQANYDCPNCSEQHSHTARCPKGKRAPTLLEILSLIDADANGSTNDTERHAAQYLMSGIYTSTSNAIERVGKKIQFYSKPILGTTPNRPGEIDTLDQTELPTFSILGYERKDTIKHTSGMTSIAQLLTTHQDLKFQLYAPRAFQESSMINLPASEFCYPLAIICGPHRINILLELGTKRTIRAFAEER